MGKTLKKKTTKSISKKDLTAKKRAVKKAVTSNKKTISATSKKSVNKKVEKPIKKQLPVKKAKKNQEPLVKANIDYENSTFHVTTPELGFLKMLDGNFGVKLTFGVNVKRTEDLKFEFSGTNADGEAFGTIFECIDKVEADTFMNELIDFSKSGEVAIAQQGQSLDLHLIKEDSKIEEPKNDYGGVPLKTENMAAIVDELRINEQKVQGNNPIFIPQTTVQENTSNTNPITPPTQITFPNNIQPEQQLNIQPPISHTLTPDPHFNPTIPSQNPMLSPDQNYYLHNAQVLEKMKQTPPVITNEMILQQMRNYGNSIEELINKSFHVQRHGKLPMAELLTVVKNSSSEYSYDVKNDGKGYFLNINKDNFQLRVPENYNDYLKVS